MDLNARKDHFSRAVVRAIAAAAGVAASVPEYDQNSEDVHFAATDGADGPGPKLDAQLKCSATLNTADGEIAYPLKAKNYNELRWPREQLFVPRILILVHVPENPDEWLASDAEKMVLRRCAYWKNLAGEPPSENSSSVTVKIPTEQVFDVKALLENLQPPGSA